jgi:hypothetical protein
MTERVWWIKADDFMVASKAGEGQKGGRGREREKEEEKKDKGRV